MIVGDGRRARDVEAEVAKLPRAALGRDDRPAHGRAAARPRVRRVRAVVEDRGPAARRARGDGGRAADRHDRGRRAARASSTRARPACSCRSTRRRCAARSRRSPTIASSRARWASRRARRALDATAPTAWSTRTSISIASARSASRAVAAGDREVVASASRRACVVHLEDVVAEQAQIARGGERDAIAGAPDQPERPAVRGLAPGRARRTRRRRAPTSPRRCRAPRSGAGPRGSMRPPTYGRSTRAPSVDRSTSERAVLALADDLPAHGFDIDPGTDSTKIAHAGKFSGRPRAADPLISVVAAYISEPRHRDLRQEHRVGHRAVRREPADVEAVDRHHLAERARPDPRRAARVRQPDAIAGRRRPRRECARRARCAGRPDTRSRARAARAAPRDRALRAGELVARAARRRASAARDASA